ncbi:MAG: CoA transferase, partial [bacterium]|nr:CoA transferase [bacterium]
LRRWLHRDDVREASTAWPGGRTKAEVVDALADQVPCGPVNNAADLAGNEQVKARKMLVAVDHPGSARPVVTPNTPIRFAESPTGVYRPAPKLGEHTDEVMAELKAAELKSKESQ